MSEMATFPCSKSRRGRNLPAVQAMASTFTKNDPIFWCSYHSALNWIRTHQYVISKCVQLLQIYPNLIQDPSMDNFWDFIEPLVRDEHVGAIFQRRTEYFKHKRSTDVTKHHEKEHSVKGLDIPQISVTEANIAPGPCFIISAQNARTPRVHLISRCNDLDTGTQDRLLHVGVLDMLNGDFYVRVSNINHRPGQAPREQSQRQFVVAESDVCVFLFNDATLEDSSSFHDLCLAMAQRIPIVYVRYHKKELPKTFSQTITRNSQGCITLQEYVEKFINNSQSATSSTSSSSTSSSSTSSSCAKNFHAKNKLMPLITGKRSESSSELSIKQRGNILHETSVSLDLVFTLVNSFKDACVFDEADLDACTSRLRQELHHILGIYESTPDLPSMYSLAKSNVSPKESTYNADTSVAINSDSNKCATGTILSTCPDKIKPTFLSVPDPEDLISTREWGHVKSKSSSARSQSVQDDLDGVSTEVTEYTKNMSLWLPTLQQKSTTYLIFANNEVPDCPRKIDFPVEVIGPDLEAKPEIEDYHISVESPINFYEIDLSREINSRGTPGSDVPSVF